MQSRIDQTDFRRILTRAIILPLIAMLALAGILIWQITSLLNAAQAVEHSDRVIAQMWEVEKLLLDLQTSVRGYLVIGDQAVLDPYYNAGDTINAEFAQLDHLVSDNPHQTKQLELIYTDYTDWKSYTDGVIALKEQGGDYQSVIQTREGLNRMNGMRMLVDDFLTSEQRVRDMRSQDAQHITQMVVASSLGLTLIVGMLLALFSRRQLLALSHSYGEVIRVAQERSDELAEQRERLQVTLSSIGDAVIVTDISGNITFINPIAQALTGWDANAARGRPLTTVFSIVNEQTGLVVENPVSKVLRDGVVIGLADHTLLIAHDGTRRPIDNSAAPIRDTHGQIVGVVLVFRDITERKQAEAALSASEERFRTLFEHSPMGIALARDGNLLYCNAAVLDMFAYADVSELTGRPITDLTIPELRADMVDRSLRRQYGELQSSAYETVGLRKDGTIFPFSVNVNQLLLPDGYVAVAFMADITERKRAEVALRASEQRYRDLADAMPLVVWIAGPDGAIEYFSQRWYETTGLTAEQSLGWQWIQVVHPEDQAECLQQWNEAVQTGILYEMQYRWRHADARYRWYLGLARPVYDISGQLAYWVGTSTDIDDQKRIEDQQRLLASAGKLLVGSLNYESMLEQLAQLTIPHLADRCAVHIFDDNGLIQRLVMAGTRTKQATCPHTNIESPVFEPGSYYLAPQVVERGIPEVYAVLPYHVDESSIQAEQLRILQAQGFTSYMCLPMIARNRILGAITFIAAESGRNYGPAELRLAEDLSSRAAMAVDNARLYHDAQAAISARDQFLSIAAHELKTPLTSLMGYIDLLQRRALREGGFGERDQRAIRVVGEQAVRLNKLIGALLDLSRIETGQLSIERGVVDLNELVRHLVEDTKHTLDEQHSITFTCAPSASKIIGDELRLEQVLHNLIQNAVKYSPHGGTIHVSVAQQQGMACISVEDQGIGIPTSALSQLFRRFYRAPNADPRHISGMGIGLYVVKEIVELHGGSISVESEEGIGSTFKIAIPLMVEHSEAVGHS